MEMLVIIELFLKELVQVSIVSEPIAAAKQYREHYELNRF